MVIEVSSRDARIPPDLPTILKNYTKSAIRTQPRDLLSWSLAYFKALCNGETPPVKDHLEFPLPNTPSGLTPGLLRVLHNKFAPMESITKEDLTDLTSAFGLDEATVDNCWESAEQLGEDIKLWTKIFIELIKHISEDILHQLSDLMISISSDMFTKKVAIEDFKTYFDMLHTNEEEDVLHKEAVEYFEDVASYQNGFLTPADLNRPTCPLAAA